MRQIQGLALTTLASVAFGGLVLVFGGPLVSGWSPLGAADLAPFALAVGAGLVLFCALVLATSRRRRRRHQNSSAVEVPAEETAEDLQVVPEDVVDGEELPDIRVLQAQIRSLEEALEHDTDLVPEPGPISEPAKIEAVEELLHRLQATLRGLGVRMAGDPAAAQVLARVEAAIDRLVAPTTPFVRPTLTVAHQVETLTTPELAPTLGAPQVLAAPAPEVAVEEAAREMPAVDTAYAAPVLATPLEDEVVLPIPARTPNPENRRGRRWLRGSAA